MATEFFAPTGRIDPVGVSYRGGHFAGKAPANPRIAADLQRRRAVPGIMSPMIGSAVSILEAGMDPQLIATEVEENQHNYTAPMEVDTTTGGDGGAEAAKERLAG